MKVEYSQRAVADLRRAGKESRAYGEMVAAAVEIRLGEVISQISEHPESAPTVTERSGVHVFPLIRYPYKIFNRTLEDRVRILHIRHTSRQVWEGQRL